MICPNCGEDNSQAFRFCGMCGTPLVAQSQAPSPDADAGKLAVSAPAAQSHRGIDRRSEPRVVPVTLEIAGPPERPATISGPSLLGLDSDAAPEPVAPAPEARRPFSPAHTFLEPAEPGTGRRRVLLLLALLAALGVAAWWTYSNYLRAANRVSSAAKPSPQPAATKPDSALASAANPETEAKTPSPEPSQQKATAEQVQSPVSRPESKGQAAQEAPTPKPAMRVTADRPKNTPAHPSASTTASGPPDSGGTGDADYRKAEAYLYGRGVPENCDEAVRLLKAASAKQSAKARSTFGTMYATGHCVPRDLPTSYEWFALALRVDPNNQILEKDLTAIWNQMTPPERQMATKQKQ